jgi:hypothetical protein
MPWGLLVGDSANLPRRSRDGSPNALRPRTTRILGRYRNLGHGGLVDSPCHLVGHHARPHSSSARFSSNARADASTLVIHNLNRGNYAPANGVKVLLGVALIASALRVFKVAP